MSPADIEARGPAPDDIVRAAFAAARLEGDDPLDVLQGRGGVHARVYAFLALAHQYPTAPRRTLAARCGHSGAANLARHAALRGGGWFDLGRLNAVRAALGWPPLGAAAAADAALLYCGRSWREFLPSGAQDVGDAAATLAPDPACIEADGNPAVVDWGPSPARPQESPAPITNADAKASTGKAPSPDGSGAGTGLRVGAAEGAQAPRDAGAGFGPARADIAGLRARRSECLDCERWSPADNHDLHCTRGAHCVERAPAAPRAIEDNDLPCAPPVRAAAAVVETARAPRKLGPLARVIDRRSVGGDATAALCGDPPPGRSALDQRQARR